MPTDPYGLNYQYGGPPPAPSPGAPSPYYPGAPTGGPTGGSGYQYGGPPPSPYRGVAGGAKTPWAAWGPQDHMSYWNHVMGHYMAALAGRGQIKYPY
jgi:hypothetical protein